MESVTTVDQPAPTSQSKRIPRRGGMIAVAAAAAFRATFNETFLNVAFTPIMADFGVTVATVQWLTTGYLLVAVTSLIGVVLALLAFRSSTKRAAGVGASK